MMPFYLKSLPFLLHALVLVGPLHAQDDAAKVKIRLLAFVRVGADLEVLLTDPEDKPLLKDPLALPTQQLSPYAMVASRKIVFRSAKDPDVVVGKCVLPASGKDYVLMFLSAPEDAGTTYFVHPVALPASSFGSGDYAFLNYSGGVIGCKINDKRFLIGQGKRSIFKGLRNNKDASNCTILCYDKKGEKWNATPFFSSRLIIQPGVRTIILIARDPRTKKIVFRGVPDILPKQLP